MTERSMHPDDARALLETWHDDFEDAQLKLQDYQEELPGIIQQCLSAGLKKGEIAEIAGLSRTTIHRHTKGVTV